MRRPQCAFFDIAQNVENQLQEWWKHVRRTRRRRTAKPARFLKRAPQQTPSPVSLGRQERVILQTHQSMLKNPKMVTLPRLNPSISVAQQKFRWLSELRHGPSAHHHPLYLYR
jgi:hypothetical protein